MSRILKSFGVLMICASSAFAGTPPAKKAAQARPVAQTRPVAQARPAVASRPGAAPVARASGPAPRAAAQAIASPAALQAAAMSGAGRSPASVMSATMGSGTGGGGSKDISEELKIMGQSRNLSMGLLFQKDKDKLTFGTPRTNYEDKVSDKKANF